MTNPWPRLPKTVGYKDREGMRFEHRYRCDNRDDPGGVQNGVYGVPKIYLEWLDMTLQILHPTIP